MKRAGHLYRYDVPTPPGATNWVYQRIAEGQFARVAKKKIQDKRLYNTCAALYEIHGGLE